MKVATIADCGFIRHTKSAYIGGDNLGTAPQDFEWQFADPQAARFVTDEYITQARGKGQVALLLEPFSLHPENYLNAQRMGFDYILTHDDNFVQNNEHWLWYPAGGSWVGFVDWKVYPKTKNISMLLSHKQMTYGHRLRHEIMQRYGSQIDVAMRSAPDYVKPITCLADYRYSIIVENEKSRYWFTEKLIDCLAAGTIPIYWGCPDVGRFFNQTGFFTFENVAELDYILNTVLAGKERNIYLSKLEAIRCNWETARRYCVCEDWIYQHYSFLFE